MLVRERGAQKDYGSINIPIKSAVVMMAHTVLVGCASPGKGPAYGRQDEFRRQIDQSLPVKEYGYTIKELRLTHDYQKALVVFTHPAHQPARENSQQRPDLEFTLESDGFGRYRGISMQPFYTPGTATTLPVSVTVTFPQN